MPVRRREVWRKKNRQKKIKSLLFLKLLFVLGTILVTTFFILAFWSPDKKIVIAINGQEDIIISSFDFEREEIINVHIPGDTEVSVAGGLGTLKIKNIWQLGVNEGIGGRLFKNTVVKNFYLPASFWADSQVSKATSAKFFPGATSVFSSYDTNLNLLNKLKIIYLTLGAKNTKKLDIYLSDSSFLKKTKLVDGSEGFVTQGALPEKIAVLFSDDEIVIRQIKLAIYEGGSEDGVRVVSEVAKVLGAKVAAVTTEGSFSGVCSVSAVDGDVGIKFAEVFGCKSEKKQPDSNFDVEITLGDKFLEEY